MAEQNQVSEDDWAAAMQEQAKAEEGAGESDADVEAALREVAETADSPYQAKPASQLFRISATAASAVARSTTST